MPPVSAEGSASAPALRRPLTKRDMRDLVRLTTRLSAAGARAFTARGVTVHTMHDVSHPQQPPHASAPTSAGAAGQPSGKRKKGSAKQEEKRRERSNARREV
jgi:hypothetical protein